MANCHKNFFTARDSFHSKISLDASKINSLRTSRDNLRKHIRTDFEEHDRPKIKFQMQGSFIMNTTVNPLDEDYDIDDGIYFSPSIEDRPTPQTVHNWVVDAAKSYRTVDPPVDKKRCVRVPFKSGYHVDFPIYDLIEVDGQEDPEPYLAVKVDGWIFSDPVKITNWFNQKAKNNQGQLKRVVRYFKAWADQENQSARAKMPSGLILTILATEEFYHHDSHDDSSFGNTASAIYERLSIDEDILNPVDSTENLRDRITDAQFSNFLNRLDVLIRSAETALEHSSKEEAAKEWTKRLGDRFPVYEDSKNKATKFSAAVAGTKAIKKNTSSA